MNKRTALVLGLFIVLAMSCLVVVYAQEAATADSKDEAAGDVKWVWGEVVSVDTQKNELVLKYLDYDTEQEKEMTIAAENATTYENINSFSDIKAKDTLSIDYTASTEGKNIAKNISIEKAGPKDLTGNESVSAEGNESVSVPVSNESATQDLAPVNKTE